MVWTDVQKSALFIINSDFAANIQLFFETTKMSLLFCSRVLTVYLSPFPKITGPLPLASFMYFLEIIAWGIECHTKIKHQHAVLDPIGTTSHNI